MTLGKKQLLIKMPEFLFWALLYYVPFHALITTWIISGTGQPLLVKAVKDVVALMLFAYCLVYAYIKHRDSLRSTLLRPFNILIGLYLLVTLVYFAFSPVAETARSYALLVNTRFLLFFIAAQLLVVITAPSKARSERRLKMYVLTTILTTSVFGLMQLYVAEDFMERFGYGPGTITPVFTLDSQADVRRIPSTLRGPNPFGVFLVFGISFLVSFFAKARSLRNRTAFGAVLAISLAALYFTYSRSAWVALLLAAVAYTAVYFTRFNKKILLVVGAGFLAFSVSAFVYIEHSSYLQRTLLHRDTRNDSKIAKSDEIHLSSIQLGIDRVKDDPMGCYLGCSGPATYYNTGAFVNLPENYYLQIAQEVGVGGLMLLIAVFTSVAYQLFKLRRNQIAVILLATFVGICGAGMFLHVWTDDTIAYVWWGLAGYTIALYSMQKRAIKHQ